MTMLKRSILILAGLLLILISIFNYINDISPEHAMVNILIGLIVVIFNYVLIYKRATTIYYVVVCEEMREKIENKAGNHND